MKSRLLACLSLSLVMAGGLGSAIFGVTNEVEKAEGYSSTSLTTTIDLNDTSATDIRKYYKSLNSLSTTERQGTNLLKNLKGILKNGQKYYSYDSGNAIWQIYEITDRDWTKSPAGNTTYGTYNSTTNKITNYVYGTGSGSNAKNNPYIHALYINRDVTNETTAWDDHQQTQWGINREHVWPKAEGFETSGAGGARGDPMHLMAGNGYANNIHSNYYYGYVKTSSSYTDCGSKYSNQSGNLRGTSKTLSSGTVFEPQDCDKGDIARAIFYMVARYNYLSNSDSDGIDSNNPNLTLTQNISDWASSGYESTTSNPGKMGILTDLLNWHHKDPVDEYEIHRNNLLYTNYTNNRNPFIDFPEWVDFIWGTATYNGTSYQSYSSTPTGYATPSSDTINGYNGGSADPVAVTGVSFEETAISIAERQTRVLPYIIAPANATNQGVTWSSSDSSVATVNASGRVEGVAEGTATITVRTSDGGFTATCTVTVTEGSGSTEGTEEGSVEAASGALPGWTASGTGSAYADGSVKLDGSGDNVYKTDIFSIDVSSVMTELTVTINGKINGTPTADNSYKVEALDSSGNVLNSVTKTGADIVTTSYGDTEFKIDSNLTGCSGFRITYVAKGGGNWGIKTVSWSASYSTSGQSEPTLEFISIKTPPTKLEYSAGDGFEPSGLVITATYSDESSVDIPYADNEDMFEFNPNDNLKTSDTSVTISYGGTSCTQSITVVVATESISAEVKNDRTFYVGETITKNDITITTNTGIDVTEYSSFSSYTFTYDDAASGGTLTNKTLTACVTYSTFSCDLTVKVQRKARESSITDTLTYDLIGVSGTQYKDWDSKSDLSTAVYAGQSAGGTSGSGNCIQIRSNNNNSGIISTSSGGLLHSVSITFNEETVSTKSVNIYGKNTAYSSPTDLYSDTTKGTLLGSISPGTTSLKVSGSYTYIGIRSSNAAIYIDEIKITYGDDDTALNVANYIMYEDTTNQCNTKTDTAVGYFNGLSAEEKTTFMTSTSYVISTARERLNAWLRNQGKSIVSSGNDYVVQANKNVLSTIMNSNNMTTIIAVILSSLGVASIGGYIMLRRKKED